MSDGWRMVYTGMLNISYIRFNYGVLWGVSLKMGYPRVIKNCDWATELSIYRHVWLFRNSLSSPH
jgi:hypothetical protein